MNYTAIQRRDFLKHASLALSAPLIFGCRGHTRAQESGRDILSLLKKNARASGDQSWTGAVEAPNDVSRKTVLSTEKDGVVPIMISGTVFERDGRTPARDILIYIYHTDAEGYYGRGNEHRHGRYRGWMLTGPDGRYEFRSIKPASYPNSTVASHIHMTLTGLDFEEDWVDSILFEGDRHITAAERRIRRGGFDPVVSLVRSDDGIFRATRDIRLWR